MDTLFEEFTISILKLNKVVQRIKLYEMESFGLQAIHVMCIFYIAHSEEGVTVGDLARQSMEDKAAVSRAISLLKSKGYVQEPTQKYNSKLRLTDEGRKVAEFIDGAAERAVNAGMADTLNEETRREFYNTLNHIYANLKTYYDGLVAKRKENKK